MATIQIQNESQSPPIVVPHEQHVIDRLRSGQACLGCRKRKNRCDAEHPVCGFCKKRRLDCRYASSDRRHLVSESYVTSLKEKVRKLEHDLNQSRSRAGGNTRMSATPPPSDAAEGVDGDGNGAGKEDESDQNSEGHLELEHESLDVLQYDGATVQTVLAEFGLTPITSSVKRKRAITDSRSDVWRRKPRGGGVIRTSNELDRDNYVLPERALATTLVDAFFKHIFPLHPYVHEPTFRKRFSETYNGEKTRTADIVWQSTMNLVFAFGCDYLDMPLDQIYELAQTFHRRAELILSVCFNVGTVEVVQALLLLSGHLQSNMQFNKVWTSMGCIIRTAHALGMHLDPTNWNISPIEKELRKRLWWGIYALDRFYSLKHLRPPAVTAEMLPVGPPETVDDAAISATGIKEDSQNPSDYPSPIHFFNATVQLAHITETMLMSVFKDTPWFLPGSAAGQTDGVQLNPIHLNIQMGLAIEQEGRLSVWLTNLPEHLQYNECETDERFKREQLMLRIRYLHTRLMIHRQNLLSVIQHDKQKADMLNDKLLRTVIMASVRQCAECACEIVSLVGNASDSRRFGPWWYNVQFVFTSLGTLLGVQSRTSIAAWIDSEAVHSAIETAMDYLHQLGDVSPVATRCTKYFESLRTWAIDKRSPLDAAIIQNVQLPASVRTTATTRHHTPQIQEQSDFSEKEHEDMTLPSFFGDTLIGSSSELFLEPLLPDLDFDAF